MALLLSLGALALIDSTSIGTLVIPIFLMLVPGRAMPRRVLVYLATVAVFYFGVGAALTLGLMPVLRDLAGRVADYEPLYWAEAVVGVGLFALSYRFDPKRRAARGVPEKPGWAREKVEAVRQSNLGMVALGITAAGIEAATMLPYLAAMGLLGASGLPAAGRLPILAAYNLVMVLPALVLLAARYAFRRHMDKALDRLAGWVSRNSASMLSWTLAIAGFLLARDGVARLFF